MKMRFVATAVLLCVILIPTLAQDAEATQVPRSEVEHRVIWDDYSLIYTDEVATGVAVRLEQAGRTEGDAYIWPRSVEFILEWTPYIPIPTGASIPFRNSSPIRITFHDAADLQAEPVYQRAVDEIHALLAERPDLSVRERASTLDESLVPLPSLPPMQGAGTVLIARAQYVETESFTGYGAIIVGRQSYGPFKGDELVYTFQGVSHDGQTYVYVWAPLMTELFPLEPTQEETDLVLGDWNEELEAYFAESVSKINQAMPDQFSPSLDELEVLIQAITVK